MTKLAILVVLGFTLLLPAAAEGATPTFEAATFNASVGATSDLDLDLAISADNAAPARIVIYVPQGYGLNTGVPAGTSVGTIDATAVVGGSSLQIPEGKILADNPASHAADPCAPGAHAAVWVAHAATFAIPIYVDPTAGPETALGAYKLVVCLLSPYVPESAGGAPSGARLTEAGLAFFQSSLEGVTAVLTNPSSRGIYTWRVLVTPYTVGSAAPNALGRYELRGDVFIPATLTLKKKSYIKKTKTATLTGRLVLVGRTLPGVPIDILRADNGKHVGKGKTNKQGIYTAKVKLPKTATLFAILFASQDSCDPSTPAPPQAPAGCASETSTFVLSKPTRVVAK
jgi:hypothetical protein